MLKENLKSPKYKIALMFFMVLSQYAKASFHEPIIDIRKEISTQTENTQYSDTIFSQQLTYSFQSVLNNNAVRQSLQDSLMNELNWLFDELQNETSDKILTKTEWELVANKALSDEIIKPLLAELGVLTAQDYFTYFELDPPETFFAQDLLDPEIKGEILPLNLPFSFIEQDANNIRLSLNQLQNTAFWEEGQVYKFHVAKLLGKKLIKIVVEFNGDLEKYTFLATPTQVYERNEDSWENSVGENIVLSKSLHGDEHTYTFKNTIQKSTEILVYKNTKIIKRIRKNDSLTLSEYDFETRKSKYYDRNGNIILRPDNREELQLFDVTHGENFDVYISMLATLDTDMLIDFFSATYDYEFDSNNKTKGATHYMIGEYAQIAQESFERNQFGTIRCDCEDLANLFKAVVDKKNDINGDNIHVPKHVTFIYQRIKNGKTYLGRFGTFGNIEIELTNKIELTNILNEILIEFETSIDKGGVEVFNVIGGGKSEIIFYPIEIFINISLKKQIDQLRKLITENKIQQAINAIDILEKKYPNHVFYKGILGDLYYDLSSASQDNTAKHYKSLLSSIEAYQQEIKLNGYNEQHISRMMGRISKLEHTYYQNDLISIINKVSFDSLLINAENAIIECLENETGAVSAQTLLRIYTNTDRHAAADRYILRIKRIPEYNIIKHYQIFGQIKPYKIFSLKKIFNSYNKTYPSKKKYIPWAKSYISHN